MADNFFEDFMRGRMLRQEFERKKSEYSQADEEHNLRIEALKVALSQSKLQQKLDARTAQKDLYSFMEGLSGKSAEHQPITMGGIEELGLPAVTATPRTREEVEKGSLESAVAQAKAQAQAQKDINQVTMQMPSGANWTGPGNMAPAVYQAEAGVKAETGRRTFETEQQQRQFKHAEQLQKIEAASAREIAMLNAQARLDQNAGDAASSFYKSRIAELGRLNATLIARGASENELMTKLPGEAESEVERLKNSPEGPGARRDGAGRKMPEWLQIQYARQAQDPRYNPNKFDARQLAALWAMQDGWFIYTIK